MDDVHPHSLLIDRLGGNAVVAKLFRISSQAVSKYRKGGMPDYRIDILRLVHPEIFEESSPEEQKAA